jgi:hypothetical protein
MTQALQAVEKPDQLLNDMLRVGKQAIITFLILPIGKHAVICF